MRPNKIRAAEALYPILSPFHVIGETTLYSIRQVSVDGCLEQVIFEFEPASLIVIADKTDDSVCVEIAKRLDADSRLNGVDSSDAEPWKSFVGNAFGWGWLTVNQQGYCDGLLLSFGGITPQLLLNIVASSIKVSKITPV